MDIVFLWIEARPMLINTKAYNTHKIPIGAVIPQKAIIKLPIRDRTKKPGT